MGKYFDIYEDETPSTAETVIRGLAKVGSAVASNIKARKKKELFNTMLQNYGIDTSSFKDLDPEDYGAVLDLLEDATKVQQRKGAVKWTPENLPEGGYIKSMTSGGDLTLGFPTPEQQRKQQLQAVGETLRNRIAETKTRLGSLPETGASPVTVRNLQEQGLGDIEALRGISPAIRMPKFEVPKQPVEFTRPITKTEPKKKVGLLDEILSGEPSSGVEERVRVKSPTGKVGTVPKSQLQDAINQGYKPL